MNRPVLITAAGIAVIALAIGWSYWNHEREIAPTPPAESQAQAPAGPPGKEAAETAQPSFDIVRINPEGEAVMAGRAQPKAEVTILDGETELGRVVADGRGEWVFVPERPLAPGTRELSLRATNPDGTVSTSKAPVILTLPERSGGKGSALAVRVNPDGTVDILTGPAAEGGGPVSIDAVRHDDQGRLAASGHAAPGATVRLYLDNKPLAETRAGPDGRWAVQPKTRLDPGEHTVRVDQIDAAGKVQARAEISFSLPGESGQTVRITVEAGNSLWRIARRTLGNGLDFTVIYRANKEQIRDPDLIYPGQVLTIPRGN